MEAKVTSFTIVVVELLVIAAASFFGGPWYGLAVIATLQLMHLAGAMKRISEDEITVRRIVQEDIPLECQCDDCEFFQPVSEPKEIQHGSATEESEQAKNG